MTETALAIALSLGPYLAAGAAIGVLYCLALWHAVQGLATGSPAALVAGMLVRVAVVAGALAFVSQGGGGRLAALVVGFVLARTLAVRVARRGLTRG